jgi:PKD repeat protein
MGRAKVVVRGRVVRLVVATLIAGFLLPVVASSDAAAAYPSDTPPANLPPGSVKVPFSIQTFQYSTPPPEPGADARCWSKTFVVFDGQYGIKYTAPNGPAAYLNWQQPGTNRVQYNGDVRSTSLSTADGRRSWTLGAVDGAPTVTFPDRYGVPIPVSAAPPDPPDGDCRDALPDWKTQDEGYAANAILWSLRNDNDPPVAGFTYEVTDPATNEVTFTSTSTDPEGSTLQHAWNFGDDTTSTTKDPTHTYAEAGSYTVTLRVTDPGGLFDDQVAQVVVSGGLVVNSTGDAPAEDADETGCTTGGTVDGAPECTLRAAIETANARGGGEITFDIAGAGVPKIATSTALPPVTASTSIDGTSQAGSWVEVAASGKAGIELEGGTSTLTGLVINGAEASVGISGGSEHEVTGNRLATDATGAQADDAGFGVAVIDGDRSTITDNVIGGSVALAIAAAATETDVSGNAIGVGPDRSTPIGDPEGGVIVFGPDTEVRDNVVRGSSVGVNVIGAAAEGTIVDANRVGVNGTGTAVVEGTGYGIRVDGTPEVTISGNHVVADDYGAIVTAGSRQATETEQGRIQLESPALAPLDRPVTGGETKILGNTVGIVGTATDPDDDATHGIVTWASASDVTIEDNTIGGEGTEAIEIDGGADHRVVANRIGTLGPPVSTGIDVTDAATSTIGGPGTAGNTIVAADAGIWLSGDTTTARVEANRITGAGAEHAGITAEADALELTVTGNAVEGGKVGIEVDAEGATITANTVDDQVELGIDTAGDDTTVSTNTVFGGGDGIAVGGADVTVTTNRVGLANGSDTVIGTEGTGIGVVAGNATVSRNLVAGSGADGIEVAASATATLRSNRVWQTEDLPLAVADGTTPPTLAAAIRSDAEGSVRTTLLVTGLPDGDAGTIEVFAGDSCTDPEPRFLLEINRVKAADETARIIQVIGNATRDHYTVTYTTAEGETGELSNCVDHGTYPDGDGDGAVDPFDAVLNADDDPTRAVIATDDEQLLVLGVTPFDPETGEGGGQFEGIAITDDPSPGDHPSGWSLPYGAIGFRITGLDPGGRTGVVLFSLTESSPIAGTSYWKYGPQVTGGADEWFDFSYDEETGTGAVLTDALDLPGVGIRRAFGLRLADGARGDSDGGANGSITDPGGPVIFAGDPPPPPTTTTTTPTTPTTTSTPSTTAPPTTTTTGVSDTSTSVPTSTTATPGTSAGDPPAPGTVDDGTLARTGTDPRGPLAAALVLLAVGALAALSGRRART